MKLQEQSGRARRILVALVGSSGAAMAALLTVGAMLHLQGRDPIPVFSGMLRGGFGDTFALGETLVAATPIMLCALSVAVARWVGLITIGAEGQLYLGAIGATAVALSLPNLASWQLLPLMILAASVCGGLWAGLPGVLRAKLNINETIVTLLLNYVAILFVQYLVHGPWRDPASYSWPQSAAFSVSAQLPRFGSTRVHLGLCFGLSFALLFWFALSKTRVGFIARVVGSGPAAAKYAHYPIETYLIGAMVLSGVLSALAGFGQVSAIEGRLRPVLSPGYGYTGFLVAWLARHNPVAIVLVSFLMAGLLSGADALQLNQRLPAATVNIFQGLIFFFLLGAELKIRRTSRALERRGIV